MYNELEKRIKKIEKSNRLLKVVLSFSLIAVIIIGFTGNSNYENIKAKSLDIVNNDGKTVLHMGVRSSDTLNR